MNDHSVAALCPEARDSRRRATIYRHEYIYDKIKRAYNTGLYEISLNVLEDNIKEVLHSKGYNIYKRSTQTIVSWR